MNEKQSLRPSKATLEAKVRPGDIRWKFCESRVALFDARGEWQCVLLGGWSAIYAEAEIFAPAGSRTSDTRKRQGRFGEITIIILNAAEKTRSLIIKLPARDDHAQA